MQKFTVFIFWDPHKIIKFYTSWSRKLSLILRGGISFRLLYLVALLLTSTYVFERCYLWLSWWCSQARKKFSKQIKSVSFLGVINTIPLPSLNLAYALEHKEEKCPKKISNSIEKSALTTVGSTRGCGKDHETSLRRGV